MAWDEYFSDWEYILSLLPSGWKEKFLEYKLLKFGRKFDGPNKESDFLRVIFMHLACGYSLRTTVSEAKEGGIVDISDVTLYHHFKKCGNFFAWSIGELLRDNRAQFRDLFKTGRAWKAVDGTVVREQGQTGSLHRLHYSLNLNDLSTDQVLIKGAKTGESLKHFEIHSGDIYLGDRGFAKFPGIAHVVDGGGDVLCRFSPQFLKFTQLDGKAFPLMSKLRQLQAGTILDADVFVVQKDCKIYGRICAIRRTPESAETERKHVIRSAQLKGRKPGDETLARCDYLLIFTTLKREDLSAANVLRAYRLRWQIEIVFKRLKSLLELGQLHKYDPVSIQAYFNGKMLIALLIEKMILQAEEFSPL